MTLIVESHLVENSHYYSVCNRFPISHLSTVAWGCIKGELQYFFTWTLFSYVFMSKWLVGARIFKLVQYRESAAAGSSETGYNVTTQGRCAPSLYIHKKCLFLPPTGSDCYYGCLTTLRKGPYREIKCFSVPFTCFCLFCVRVLLAGSPVLKFHKRWLVPGWKQKCE